MARKLRLEYAGACYHVINRGNYRRDVFAPKGASASFEQCLFEACEKFGWRLHAFVIMRNHFHLAVETPEPNLSAGMKWLQGTWAMRFNRFRGEVGRPFQGRYKALHVEPGEALAQVCHYIHLNPVRARVLPAERVGEFARGSLAWFVRKGRPKWLVGETVLAESGGLADTPAGWRKYLEYLGFLAEEDAKRREERFGRLSRGWMVGSREFKQGLQKDLATQGAELERAQLLGLGPVAEWREEQWEEKLQRAAKASKIDLDHLPARKSAPEKVRLAAVLKTGTSVSNGWLAERLAMGQPASVSQFVRRFRLAKGHEQPWFQAALSRVKT
ncbi:MAG: transposase [Opitutae bacterium]|nr:transposase [Opitutae bacterium]